VRPPRGMCTNLGHHTEALDFIRTDDPIELE
jgi:hypothetical protein